MDVSIEMIFFFVFFAPMGILVAVNLLLHRALPVDVVAPWARVAAPLEEPQPAPRHEAPVPDLAEEAENEDEALEAA